jgi:peptidyl-tRNA hydrolase, PTH2 family
MPHNVTTFSASLSLSNISSKSALPDEEFLRHKMQSHILNWIREMRADPQAQRELAFNIALGMACLTIGYLLGGVSNSGLFDPSTANRNESSQTKKSWPNSYDVIVHADSSNEETGGESDGDDEDMDGDGKELKSFEDTTDEVKLVLVVRTDLNMGRGRSRKSQVIIEPCISILFTIRPLTGTSIGKIAAQASHATLACYKYLLNHAPSASLLKRWERGGQTKIVVQVKTEEELLTLQAQAMSLGLCAKIIQDAGRTQIAAGSITVLGILGPKQVVNQVTGQLKLL